MPASVEATFRDLLGKSTTTGAEQKKFNKDLQRQVNDLNKRLHKLLKGFNKKERKKILRVAAKPLVKAAKEKLTGRTRHTPRKRFGNIYHYGNLLRSIKIKSFRKSPDLFVGPIITGKGNEFGKPGAGTDPYYGHMVEFGTRNMRPNPYMRPAYAQTKGVVKNKVIKLVQARVKKLAQQNRLK